MQCKSMIKEGSQQMGQAVVGDYEHLQFDTFARTGCLQLGRSPPGPARDANLGPFLSLVAARLCPGCCDAQKMLLGKWSVPLSGGGGERQRVLPATPQLQALGTDWAGEKGVEGAPAGDEFERACVYFTAITI